MPAGRPTKYDEKQLEAAENYLVDHLACGDVVPTVAGLVCELGVVRSTVYKWADENPVFSDTLKAIKDKQERMLVNGGLNGELNPAITKLMMANHGYSDKVEQAISSPDGSLAPTKIELVGVKPSAD